MGTVKLAALAILLTLGLATLPAHATSLQLNLTTTYDPSQVYILFQGNAAECSVSYVDSTSLQTVQITLNSHGLSNSIPLTSINNGAITITEFESGVIYASNGGPLGTTAAPSPSNPGDPGYNYQWQAIAEITYSGTAGNSGDITSIQFFAVPETVQVMGGTKVLQSATFNEPGATLENQLAAISATPSVDVIKSTKGSNIGQIVRVLGPNQFGGPSKDKQGNQYYTVGGYPSLQAYVQSLYQTGATATIPGSYKGTKYTFTVNADAAGDLICTGVYNSVTYTITLQADAALNDGSGLTNYIQSWNIFSCQGSGNGITNSGSDGTSSTAGNSSLPSSIQTQVLHDLACGLNFGFINSPTIDPVTHVAFGTEPSNVWFADATTSTIFNALQPTNPYYNQYAALISNASNGTSYGFPYSDALNNGVTLELVKSGSTAVTAWNILIGDPAPDNTTPVMPWWGLVALTTALIGMGGVMLRTNNGRLSA